LISCKAVFDTNIFLSALMFGGPPEILMRVARAGQIRPVTSPQILAELASILKKKFSWTDKDILEAILPIGRHADLVKPRQKISAIDDDPDNRILECAVEGKVDYIVSGDHHLLRLKHVAGMTILGAAELLTKIRN
jgi:putative PIN family toxin of toxin-antitoxin system